MTNRKRKPRKQASNETPNCIVSHPHSYALHFNDKIIYYSKDGIHLSTKELSNPWNSTQWTNNAQWTGNTGWINFYFTLTGNGTDKNKDEKE